MDQREHLARQVAADDARTAAEVPSCCHTRGHHVHCPNF